MLLGAECHSGDAKRHWLHVREAPSLRQLGNISNSGNKNKVGFMIKYV